MPTGIQMPRHCLSASDTSMIAPFMVTYRADVTWPVRTWLTDSFGLVCRGCGSVVFCFRSLLPTHSLGTGHSPHRSDAVFLSHPFTVSRRDSPLDCLVVDVRPLHRFVVARTFPILTVAQVRLPLQEGEWLMALVLESKSGMSLFTQGFGWS